MWYNLPFRSRLTRFWQLPLLTIVVICIAYIGSQCSSLTRIAEDIVSRYMSPEAFSMPWHWIINMILLCISLFCSYSIGLIIKFFYYKPRPQVQAYTNAWEKIDASSFPSIHTSNSMVCAFRWVWASTSFMSRDSIVLVLLLSLFWIWFYVCISYSRVVLKKHYWIDLLGGTIFGLCILGGVVYFSHSLVVMVRNTLHILF